ncbi:pertactin-like passenger domain-containing protein, partial [Ursidibacter arcticus]|uniref:pertactin-like passenger domain-containing protein n=1 Tax=Ursidibacter arcticus TaxID=1524965 RepID=UPI0012F9A053
GKLSPLYIALFLSGGLLPVGYTQELECKAGHINQQNNKVLKNCTINTPMEQDDYRLLAISNSDNLILDSLTTSSNIDSLRIDSSNITIKNSNIESISGASKNWGTPSFNSVLSLDNAAVNVENSIINAKPTSSSQFNVRVNNGNLTVQNSTLRMQKIGDSVGKASAALSVTNGTAIVKNSIFDLDARADSYIATENNGKIILENVTSTNVRAYPDFLTIGEGKSSVELINSSFLGGIDSTWDLTKEVEQADVDITLTANSSLERDTLFRSTELPPASGYQEKTKQLIENINIAAKDSTLRGSVQLLSNKNGIIDDTFNVSLENSSWILGDNYYIGSPDVTDLTLKNADVTVNPNAQYIVQIGSNSYKFSTFNILGNLSGEGNFTLSTDLANQQSDKIIVKGSDSGSFGLNIRDSGNEPNAANGRVTLVETATGTAKFTLLGKDYVDAGAYRYRLNQEGNNWVLSNNAAEKAQSNSQQSAEQPGTAVAATTPTGQ